MSGFDKDWLALREPADRQARAKPLMDALRRHLVEETETPSLLDIGCGTGSTYRALSSLLPANTRWQLLDYDPQLLQEAARRIGTSDMVTMRQHDLNDLAALPLDGVSVVTASALFDLCSADFCSRFVNRLAEQAAGLYAALNYDGVMQWSVPHPLDGAVVESFNRHQRLDKGFGPALGPDATGHLRHSLEPLGYRVMTGESPWHLGPEQQALQVELLRGIEKPVSEIGVIDASDLKSWLAFRLAAVTAQNSSCVIGHSDLLAIRTR
ncbi:class I SAM-dependent methyltransferase [Rhizobium sp. AG855]|uniref:methyltransferase domain-containing protein n=1 Tax=Rhizobium sp. AG855 TaxID=2183898 RepID=UPI000E772291|nr:class I SAM-dependent methyltransferase [Rhizobium sp. AG855]RKE79171.1 methyltransferase family protein [Rhizobium sp. AG855]